MVMMSSRDLPATILAPAADPEPLASRSSGASRQIVLKAVGWSMAGYVSGYGLRLASSLIMTRLLVPEMFGVMAVATIVQVIASMLCDVGLRQSVIQSRRGDQQVFLNTAWTLQIIRGGVIWSACAICAALLAWGSAIGVFSPSSVYAEPQLPAIIAAMALSSLILGFQSTKSMTSDRHLNQRQLAVVELIAQGVGLAASITAGYLTRSIWSFVFGALVAAFAAVLLSHWYLRGPSNRFRVDHESLIELLSFGRWVLVSSIFTVLAGGGGGGRGEAGLLFAPAFFFDLWGVGGCVLCGGDAVVTLICESDKRGGRISIFFWASSCPASDLSAPSILPSASRNLGLYGVRRLTCSYQCR